jgi:hypothetical protein
MGYLIEIRRSGFEVELVVFARGRGAADTVRYGERHPTPDHVVPAAERSGLSEILSDHERDAVAVIHSALGSVSPLLSWPWTGTDLAGSLSPESLHRLVAGDCGEKPTCDADDLVEEPRSAIEIVSYLQ